jgi:hypothetical protein
VRRLLDPDRAREIRRQQRLLAAADRQFSGRMSAVIRVAMEQMIAEYERTGSIPSLPMDHEMRIQAQFHDMASVTIQAFGDRILGQGKAMGFEIETKAGFAELFQLLAEQWLSGEVIRQRITAIAQTTRRGLVNMIVRGQQEGLGVDAIAKNLRGVMPTLSRYRGHVIARTETHGAANFGAFEAAKATGLKLKKEWMSVEDLRTRDFGEGDGDVDEYNHREMNGQTVPMDQPFMMPWQYGDPIPCMHPGDTSLPVGAIINCRCTTGYVVDDGS